MIYGNYQFGGYSHEDFGKANDSVFMNELHEALSHLHPHRHELAHGDPEHEAEHERMRREFDPDDDLGEFSRERDFYNFLM